MKKSIKVICLSLMLAATAVLFTSCAKNSEPESYTVTYVYGDGRTDKTASVTEGSCAKRENPTRDGYVFVGWCTDSALSNFYDFTTSPTSDLTLYAKWTPDYEALVSEVTRNAVSFTVKIESYSYNQLSEKSLSQGSGVIYKKSGTSCFIITNNHVVAGNSNATLKKHYVYDMYGNKYEGELICSDAAYDLAILKIDIRDTEVSLGVANFKGRIPNENETVISITSPQGQFNAVWFGSVINYKTVDNEGSQTESSQIDFSVLWLDCYSNHGSSGGAVLDADLNVIGVIYAVATNNDGSFLYTFAVPAEKVLEFIAANH